MSLFAGLKEKLVDKLAEFKASAALQDPADRQATDLVDKAASDELIAADWTLNFAVVDFVNSDVRLNSGRALRAIKRNLVKQNTKVQLLALTLLETCVKNCAPEFHRHLATSELWADIVKLAGDSSVSRVNSEVRDKALVLVEDFARALQPTQFQAAYEQLLDTGVDFPVRSAHDAVPILTPPAHQAAAAAAAAGDAAAAAAPAAAAAAPAAAAAAGAGGDAADPFAGVDEQDRAAIAAALQELEAEAQAAAEAERIAAEADAEERRQRQEQQQQQLLQQRQAAEAAEAEAEAEAQAAAALLAADDLARAAAVAAGGRQPGPEATHGAVGAAAAGGDADEWQQQQPQPQAQPEAPQAELQQTAEERVTGLLETASNCTLLLSEMLASVPDTEPLAVREPYVAELADTCVRLRSRLERELSGLEDEALLASALSQHEEMARVLGRYEELLAAAESLAPTRPRNAATVAAAHAALGQGPAAHAAPPSVPPAAAAAYNQQQQEVPAGQKVSQKAAEVASALKEKFAGAFDRLMAAAAAARAPTGAAAAGASGQGGAGAPAADAYGSAYGGVALGGPLPPVQEGGEGTFTLLDDEEDESGEGTSLLTKRVPAPPPSYQPPSYYNALSEPPPPAQPWMQVPASQQQQPWAAAQAAAPAPAEAGPPAPPAADLICFDDEEPAEVPQQPGTLSPGPDASNTAVQVADPAADLLSGLSIHGTAEAADPAAAPHDMPPTDPQQAPSGPQLEPLPAAPAPVAVTHGSARVSRGGSHGDQLVAALDALVAQESVSTTPHAAAAEQQQETL